MLDDARFVQQNEVERGTLADVAEEAELIEAFAALVRGLTADATLEMEARNFARALRGELRQARVLEVGGKKPRVVHAIADDLLEQAKRAGQ